MARGHLKAQTAVILYEKTNAGNDNAEGFEKPFVAAGGLMAIASVVLLVRITRTLSADSARSAATPSAPPSEVEHPA